MLEPSWMELEKEVGASSEVGAKLLHTTISLGVKLGEGLEGNIKEAVVLIHMYGSKAEPDNSGRYLGLTYKTS